MKKWATLLPLCLSLGCSNSQPPPTDAASSPAASPVVASASPGAARVAAAGSPKKCSQYPRCPNLNCVSGNVTTRTAVVLYGANSIVGVYPDPICACVDDLIVWTYDNSANDDEKEAYIDDSGLFLSGKDCKIPKKVKKKDKDTGRCGVLKVAKTCYPYEVKGSHPLDPEVEVQGGDKGAGKSPSPGVSPSP